MRPSKYFLSFQNKKGFKNQIREYSSSAGSSAGSLTTLLPT